MNKILSWISTNLGSIGGQAIEGILKSVGESKLEAVLQELHDTNIEDYKAALEGGNALVNHLKPLVQKSTSTIDDAFLGAIEDVIITSAAKNGITL